jgi:hypothetical protein
MILYIYDRVYRFVNIVSFGNIYVHFGRPRKVPHQAWYFLCLGWDTLWAYILAKAFADLQKNVNVGNMYAYIGSPRRVPHQA